MVFESYEEAKHQLQKLELERREIRYGHRRLIQKQKTFADICDYWLDKKSCKRSAKDDKSIIAKHLLPAFGHLKLTDVSHAHAENYAQAKLETYNKKTVFNHLTLLISLLTKAKRLDWLHEVPKIEKPKIKIVSADFGYLKNKDEIGRFLEAAKSRGESFYNLYFAALMTGARAGELAGLMWNDINFDLKIISILRSYDGPTKSGEPRHIPLLDPLCHQLLHWRKSRYSEWVFPNNRGEMMKPSSRIFQERFQEICEAAGFPRIPQDGKLVPYIVFHDLRHTFASQWVMSGGDIFKLQKILGHQCIQMTMRYAHLAPHAFESDMGRLSGLVDNHSAQLLPFKTSPSS